MKTKDLTARWLVFLSTLAGCSPSGGGGEDVDLAALADGVDAHFEAAPDLPEPIELDDPIEIDRDFKGGYDCTTWERTYSHGGESYPMLEDHHDVIYPGADLQGATLSRSVPAPITAPRGGGSTVISNPNGSPVSAVTLDEVTLANVTRAVNEILAAQPQSFPADLVIRISRVRTREELQIQLEASASYFGLFSASSGFQFDGSERSSSFLVEIQQNFYTIAFERPSEPHEFYRPGVGPDAFELDVFPGNPGGYVSSVTYGRVFYLLIQANESASEMQTTLEANFNYGLFGADLDGSINYVTDLDDLRIQAYAYGGDQEAVYRSIFAGLGDLNTFKERLIEASDLLTGKPISFKVRSIVSDQLMKNGLSVLYDFVDCSPTASCVPILLSPNPQATLDNGCRFASNEVVWNFDWGDCEAADLYEIEIRHPSFGLFYSAQVANSSQRVQRSSAFLPADQLSRWTWRVRAHAYDAWRPWSAEYPFSLEPPNNDCETGVRLYSYPNFQGESLFLPYREQEYDLERINGWDDEVDSFRLINIPGLTLFEDPKDHDYGASFHFTHSCPDTREHGFRINSASVLRFDR